MDDMDLAGPRATLRTSVQRMRGMADADAILAASERAADILEALSGLQRARTLLLHHAVRGDLDPLPLLPRLAARGARVLALGDSAAGAPPGPDGVDPGGEEGHDGGDADGLVLEVLATGRAHLADVAEPHLADLELVEVVILPGVAFDLDGRRLGPVDDPWPGVLRRVDDGALRVGLARSAQLVPSVPRDPDDPDDTTVDVVVTDRTAHHTGARLGPRDA